MAADDITWRIHRPRHFHRMFHCFMMTNTTIKLSLIILLPLLLTWVAATPTPALRPQKPVQFMSRTKPTPTASSTSGKLLSISTDKSTYTFNSTVFVSFTNPQPRKDDFIAIYPVSTPSNSLFYGLFWLYTCNQRQGTGCRTAVSDEDSHHSVS